MQHRIIALKLRLFVIDATRVAQEVGLRGRTNTVLQTCFFAISGVLPRDKAIGHIKEAIRKSYGSKGEAVVQANFRAVDETLERLFEVAVPESATGQYDPPPLVPSTRAGLRARCDRRDAGGPRRRHPGEPSAGGRHLAVRHCHLGEAQHRRCRAGVGCGDLHPVRSVQLRLPARRDPGEVLRCRQSERRTGAFPLGADQCARLSRRPFHARLLDRGLHGLRALRGGLPRGAAQVARDARQGTVGGGRADGQCVLRHAAGERPGARGLRQRARRAVPRTAVRLFRCLRRLRRDALPEAAVAVVRRSAADRQCHRLFVDLRRQPAGDAVVGQPRGPRASLVELAVRGQCGIRPGLSAGSGQAPRYGTGPDPRVGSRAGSGSRRCRADRPAGTGVRRSARSESASAN